MLLYAYNVENIAKRVRVENASMDFVVSWPWDMIVLPAEVSSLFNEDDEAVVASFVDVVVDEAVGDGYEVAVAVAFVEP